MLDEANIREFIEHSLRPKTRVDGGDIEFAGMHGDKVVVNAHADCATCPATSDCLPWWLESELSARFGCKIGVIIHKRAPYFTR